VIGTQDRDAVEEIAHLVRCAAMHVDPARRLEVGGDFAAGEAEQAVGLREQGIGAELRQRDRAIHVMQSLLRVGPPDRDPAPDHQQGEVQRDRIEGKVDLEPAIAGHQGVHGTGRVADAADAEMLGTRWNVEEGVAAERVGGDGAVEVAQLHHRVGQRLPALGVADGSGHRGLRGLDQE
jgi:hypothetical protein